MKNGPYHIISNDGTYEEKGNYKLGVKDGKIYVRKGREEDNLFY